MPYAPGVQSIGGQLIGQGIANAGRNIREGIAAYQAEKEKGRGYDMALEMAMKSNPSLLDKFGEQMAKAPGMSNSQKQSLLGGIAAEIAKAEQAKQDQTRGLMNQRLMNEIAAQETAARGGSAMARVLAGMEALPAGQQGPELSPRDKILQAIAANPEAANAPGFGQNMAVLERIIESQSNPNKIPNVTQLGGRNVLYSPQTGAFQVLSDPTTEMTPYQKAMMELRALEMEANLSDSTKFMELSDEDRSAMRDRLRTLRGNRPKYPAETSHTPPRQGTSPALKDVSAAPAPAYGSAEAVRAAYQGGKLSREQAKELLKSFGY